MPRPLIAALAVAVVVLAGCGGGSKKAAPATAPTEPAATTTVEATATKAAAKKTPTPSARSSGSGADVFSTLFSSALSGSGGSGPGADSALGDGDPALKRFLPGDADLPDGYTPFGEFTSRLPDGISQSGGMDMAAKMAMHGNVDISNPSDLSGLTMLMAMVLRPDDLTALGDAFDQFKNLSQEDLEDSIAQGAGGTPFDIVDARVLDVSGLGEGAAGMQFTIDLSQLGALFGGGEDGAPALSSMTMRMYMFGRGDYIGAVIRIGYSGTLSGEDEDIALAQVIDEKLRAGG